MLCQNIQEAGEYQQEYEDLGTLVHAVATVGCYSSSGEQSGTFGEIQQR